MVPWSSFSPVIECRSIEIEKMCGGSAAAAAPGGSERAAGMGWLAGSEGHTTQGD